MTTTPRRSIVCTAILVLGASLTMGCSLRSIVDAGQAEEGTRIDPALVPTRAGGLALYAYSIAKLQSAISYLSMEVGLFTDELATFGVDGIGMEIDSRQISREPGGQIYGREATNSTGELQSARVNASHAITILHKHLYALNDTSVAASLAGAYAIEGYSILLLAENLCSGIPLTQVPFDGDVVYGQSLTTTEVLQEAIAMFDSSLAITHDSAEVRMLARVGKARAYLSLGDYDKAEEAVQGIELQDKYLLTYTQQTSPDASTIPASFWTGGNSGTGPMSDKVEILNNEGGNGLEWYRNYAQIDPRLPVATTLVNNVNVVRQRKFVGGTLKFPLARGIEAWLIRAEAALRRGDDTWIIPINEARATVGLGPLDDPLVREAREALLFRERAFWFYLEGRRLADYRRLVRQYGRNEYLTYPTGIYTQSQGDVPVYGDAWVFSVPRNEIQQNYRYEGCRTWNP